MTTEHWKRPVADHVRDMGLQVGDIIEGWEEWKPGEWNLTRLTLLWLGAEVAVWRETRQTWQRPEWSPPRETADWVLGCRNWEKIQP
jgi:hypothetical protein